MYYSATSACNVPFIIHPRQTVSPILRMATLWGLCHAKRSIMAWVGVIPKEGWACVVAIILLLVWHRLFENIIYDVSKVKFWKVGAIPKEGWAQPRAPIFLLVWQWLRPSGTFLRDRAHVTLPQSCSDPMYFHLAFNMQLCLNVEYMKLHDTSSHSIK